MKSLFVAFMVLSAASALAQEQKKPGLGFKNVPIGASLAELRAVFPWVECGRLESSHDGKQHQSCFLWSEHSCRPRLANYDQCVASMTYGGVPFRDVMFMLYDGHVARVRVWVKATHFDRLKETMHAAFGTPQRSSVEKLRTSFGHELLNDHYHWFRGGGVISAQRYTRQEIDVSSISITTPETLNDGRELGKPPSPEVGARDL